MNRRFAILAGLGCTFLIILVVGAIVAGFLFFVPVSQRTVEQVEQEVTPIATAVPGAGATQEAIPTLSSSQTQATESASTASSPAVFQDEPTSAVLTALYDQLTPGVVSVQVFSEQAFGGTGAGSGFILDDQGHIVTNNHVVAGADTVTVVFYDGFEAEAEIIGTDDDSDLAVIRVDEMPEGTHPLPLGDSDQVEAGEWVVAIGNPFGLGGSMTVGVVSAVGRVIPSGVTPFSIPQAVQTDAAINPGNSGGPLLNFNGEIIGVNAQIATGGGTGGSAGVGFAIPSNVVRRVVPVLIEQGSYQWPWLGIEGPPVGVNLAIMRANDLDTQRGAYISRVVSGGPADEAGIQGSTGQVEVSGFPGTVPVGGDVVIEANREPINDFDDLLTAVAFSSPGDEMELTILRDGRQQQVTVTLEARPENFDNQ